MSRATPFKLKPVETMDVAKRLYQVAVAEGFQPGSPENLKYLCTEIAGASGGHLREALGLLDLVHNYVHGQQGPVDWAHLIPEIVEQTPELVPYVAVQKYMEGVLAGGVALALTAVERTDNYEYFLRRVIETWQLIFARWVDEKHLFDPGRAWMLKDLQVPPPEAGLLLMQKTDFIEETLNLYASALERVKMYATDPKAVTQSVTLENIKMWRRALRSIK
jgi:hypothetical protein